MMFFLSGAIMLISTLLCFLFKETKDLVLEDAIKKRSIQENCLEIQDTIVQTSDGLEVKKSFNLKEENGTIVANFWYIYFCL